MNHHINVYPGFSGGHYSCNTSKSEMQRALLLAFLSEGESTLSPLDESNDSRTMLKNIQKLGAKVKIENNSIIIQGMKGKSPSVSSINCGESGFGLRSITPVLACVGGEYSISGEGSLCKRPLDLLKTLFDNIKGIEYNDNNSKLPLQLSGKIKPGEIEVDGSKSSQHISGLLLGLPLLNKPSTLTIHQLKSRPYLELTIELMSVFGVNIQWDLNKLLIPSMPYKAANYQVKGDWSGAAFLLVAAFLHQKMIRIDNIFHNSAQSDKAIVEVLKIAGAVFDLFEDSIKSNVSSSLNSFQFDATDAPDLFPPLAVLAAGINGESKIKGLHRLKHKESNRSESVSYLLDSFGIKSKIEEDTLIIYGGTICAPDYPIETHNDHRIAMAAIVMASLCSEPVSVLNTECINKSYPNFLNDWNSLGGKFLEL